MAKDRARAKRSGLKSVPIVHQPTVVYPVVVQVPSDHKELSEADFQALENVGGVRFEASTRRALKNIAAGWISHDRVLQSPRPRQFRKRLRKMEKAVELAIASLDLNEGNAPIPDRHLYTWLINSGFDGADDLQQSSAILTQEGHKLIDLLRRAQCSLPLDTGGSRPMDDDRFIIHLAVQFEASGGQAVAYNSFHTESGYGDTPFRKFVHQFYGLLPIESRRFPSGLDQAIVTALEYYRKHTEKGDLAHSP